MKKIHNKDSSSGTIGKQVVKELKGKSVNVRITSRKQDEVLSNKLVTKSGIVFGKQIG